MKEPIDACPVCLGTGEVTIDVPTRTGEHDQKVIDCDCTDDAPNDDEPLDVDDDRDRGGEARTEVES